jgi:hypothetical protein
VAALRPVKKCRGGYHDRVWGAKMEEVGLMPSNTGLPGGKKNGQQMTHYIISPSWRATCWLSAIKNGGTRFTSPRTRREKRLKIIFDSIASVIVKNQHVQLEAKHRDVFRFYTLDELKSLELDNYA